MISVIIPTFNRYKQLNNTLNSFTCIDFENIDFEIIIIDNGSTDLTKNIVDDFISNNTSFKIIYKFDNMPGLLTGRHLGANIASGDILTFIDDDVILSKDWLKSINNIMITRSDIDLLTGPSLPLFEAYPPKWINFFWRKSIYGGRICLWLSLIDLKLDEIEINPNYVWGLNFTIRNNVFKDLYGFNPDNIPKKYQMFQGDGETGLTRKALENNNKALYNKGVLLYHQISKERLTFEYFDNRAYYAGVCNSFSDLKYGNSSNLIIKDITFHRKIIDFINNLHFRFLLFMNPEIKLLYKRFNKKEIEGYKFHQEQYKLFHYVRAWVHQDNYINYTLPDINS
jgi:glycosyltransferase involved in cell wall biosynthesis